VNSLHTFIFCCCASLLGVMGEADFLRLLLTKFLPFLIYPETEPAVPVKGPRMPLVIVAIIDHLEIIK